VWPTVTCEGVKVSGQTLGKGAGWYLIGSDVQSSSVYLVGILEFSTSLSFSKLFSSSHGNTGS
jgi:hypothetical protein